MDEYPIELKEVVQFHGHFCPGVAIGYRVALLARKELGLRRSEDEELVAIVENDSCAVDAIQYINGATFGKGNLIFKDHGLHAYTFIRRNSGNQIRIELKAEIFEDTSENRQKILQKLRDEVPLTDAEKVILQQSRKTILKKILEMPDSELFNVKKVNVEIPEKARIFNSVKCVKCGLMVMEPRARVFNREFYCIPCWKNELERKMSK